MPIALKTFTVVFVVALIVFAVGKPLFTRFMAPEDFARRRNLWLLLSATSFLAPNMWLYLLVAVPAILVATKRDPNPVALYLFILMAVPPVSVPIPTFGVIGQVFPLHHPRVLSLALLLPFAWRLAAERHATRGLGVDSPTKRLASADVLLLAFLGLQVVLMLPYESVTSLARRILLLSIDVILPYFVVSRACRSREAIAEAMAAFVLAVVVLAPLAVLEFFRGWMLFAIVGEQWEAARLYHPLYRSSFLRAQATAGHSIFLGYFMALAFGMWLYLQSWVPSRPWRWLCMLTLLAGLVAALSRGPWVGATAILAVFLILGPNAGSRSVKGFAVVAAVLGATLVSPWGETVVSFLPFVGTVDEGSVVYRQQLAAGSWLLIQQNPIFGSAHFLHSMEEFRTGEGIIDLVNTYAIVALSYGLVGAALFIGVFLTAAWQVVKILRKVATRDPDLSLMGAALVACTVGTMVVLATTSFLHSMPYVVWAFVGLIASYVRLANELPQDTAVIVNAERARQAL